MYRRLYNDPLASITQKGPDTCLHFAALAEKYGTSEEVQAAYTQYVEQIFYWCTGAKIHLQFDDAQQLHQAVQLAQLAESTLSSRCDIGGLQSEVNKHPHNAIGHAFLAQALLNLGKKSEAAKEIDHIGRIGEPEFAEVTTKLRNRLQ